MEIPQDMLHTEPTCRICDLVAEREAARAFEPDAVELCTCPAQTQPHRPIKGVCPSTLGKAA